VLAARGSLQGRLQWTYEAVGICFAGAKVLTERTPPAEQVERERVWGHVERVEQVRVDSSSAKISREPSNPFATSSREPTSHSGAT
jgi:hypothetical protein